MLASFVSLSAAAAALTLSPQGMSTASRTAVRSTIVRMDDIPMVKADTGVVPTDRPPFSCSFEIPKKGISEYGTCNLNFKPLLTDSELVMVTYPLPFGLSAEPKGRVVAVTKDGKGGEKVGDILRFTLQWKGQQPGMFDVCSCMERRLQSSFDEVVAALVSNDGTCALSRPHCLCPARLSTDPPAWPWQMPRRSS